MIRVNQLIGRSRTGRCNKPRIECIADAAIAARNVRRSVAFYTRVFGFHIVSGSVQGRAPVIMAGPGHTHLAIHEYGGNADGLVAIRRHWGFVVDDLERVRDAVWDLGVTVALDSGEPDQIFRWSDGRSLFINDPDENEIELIEECKARDGVVGFRNCGSAFSSWRRSARPRCEAAR